MEFKLKDFHYNIPSQDMLNDLKAVCHKLGRNTITSREYNETGKFTSGTIHKRFGTWHNALKEAGLEITVNKNVTEIELFENLEQVWISLGRQPTDREMRQPLSKFSKNPYLNKFGTWRKALESFVAFINADNEPSFDKHENSIVEESIVKELVYKHKTKRIPSERLKVQVLMRDGNKCRLCGIVITGDSIHFDHVKPWAKGGETVLENLQVLCEKHNLAKGDLLYEP